MSEGWVGVHKLGAIQQDLAPLLVDTVDQLLDALFLGLVAHRRHVGGGVIARAYLEVLG